MTNKTFPGRLQIAPFGVSSGLTFAFLMLVSLLVDIVPWLDAAGRQFYARLGLLPSEAAFLSLRTREGLSASAFQAEFGQSPEVCWPVLATLEGAGLLERVERGWRLTRRGFPARVTA